MDTSFTRTTLTMSSGILIWAAHFTVIYGLTAVACAGGSGDAQWLGMNVVKVAIGTATFVALAAVLAFIVRATRAGLDSFERWMTAALGSLALIAIAWEAIVPLLIVPVCA